MVSHSKNGNIRIFRTCTDLRCESAELLEKFFHRDAGSHLYKGKEKHRYACRARAMCANRQMPGRYDCPISA